MSISKNLVDTKPVDVVEEVNSQKNNLGYTLTGVFMSDNGIFFRTAVNPRTQKGGKKVKLAQGCKLLSVDKTVKSIKTGIVVSVAVKLDPKTAEIKQLTLLGV